MPRRLTTHMTSRVDKCDTLQHSEGGKYKMAVEVLDTLGMKCPQPVLKIAVKAADMQPGDIGRLSDL